MKHDHLSCPECGSTMTEEEHHGVTIDRCGACGGLWFDIDEIHEYLAAHPALAPGDEPMAAEFRRHPSGVGERCCCCGEHAIELGTLRGIAFQRCTWCGGIFLGNREIEQIVASRAGQLKPEEPGGGFALRAASAGALYAASGSDERSRRVVRPIGDGR